MRIRRPTFPTLFILLCLTTLLWFATTNYNLNHLIQQVQEQSHNNNKQAENQIIQLTREVAELFGIQEDNNNNNDNNIKKNKNKNIDNDLHNKLRLILQAHEQEHQKTKDQLQQTENKLKEEINKVKEEKYKVNEEQHKLQEERNNNKELQNKLDGVMEIINADHEEQIKYIANNFKNNNNYNDNDENNNLVDLSVIVAYDKSSIRSLSLLYIMDFFNQFATKVFYINIYIIYFNKFFIIIFFKS